MSTIAQYMTPHPHTIGSEQSVSEAARHMRELEIRHLPVLRGGQLEGLISDRDLRIIMSFREVDPTTTPIADAIPQETYVVSSETPLAEVAAEMAEHKYGSAVVMEGNKVVGIFTTVDACRALADLA
jgi:acetoin utilization protein AcuB